MNPYRGADFFSFFATLGQRLVQGAESLAPDEVQLMALLAFSVTAAIIGPMLIYKRLTMLANALSHTTLLGVVVVWLIMGDLFAADSFFIGGILAAVLTCALVGFFRTYVRLQEDAAIGLVFTALFALALLLVTSYAKNIHLGTSVIMGSSDTLTSDELGPLWVIAGLVLGLQILFYKEWKMACFDPRFGQSVGLPVRSLFWLLMVESAAAMVIGIHTFGVVAVLACLIAPGLIGHRLARRFGTMHLLAFTVAAAAAFVAVALSRHILSEFGTALSTGALYATLLSVAAIATLVVSFRRC